MSKSSSKRIDDERKIIRELRNNSKDIIDKIAQNCGFSKQKASRIIKRLEKNKTILGYNAVINDEKSGVKRYQILLKKSPISVSDKMTKVLAQKDLRKQLEKFGVELNCSFFTHGYFDWSLCITAPNSAMVKRFTELLKNKFGDYISEIQVLEVIFPLLKSGFDNPNLEELIEYFLIVDR